MFRGITAITLDAKGRLALPTRYRDALVAEELSPLIMTIDTEETCLLLYTLPKWKIIEEKLQNFPSYDAVARRIQRLLLGHAADIEVDKSGRILLPPELRRYAQLDKQVMMVGQGNKFEIWDSALWEKRREQWLLEGASEKNVLPDELKDFSL